MLRKAYIFFIAIFAMGALQAQVPADSLAGIYAGQYWNANPNTSPWVISPDTFLMSNVDSLNCTILSTDLFNFHQGYGYYYSDYFSCNGAPPLNYFMKFYSGDSVKIIDDNEPQPYPNPHISLRFYGKRIKNLLTYYTDFTNNFQVNIYPNPTTDFLTIETTQKSTIEILNIQGQKIKEEKTKDNKTTIDHVGYASYVVDISGFSSGVYMIRATTAGGVITKKFIKE